MTVRPVNEFNLTGALSPEMARKLLYLAAIGSESLASGFRKASGVHPDGGADPAEQIVTMMMRMATEEQVRQFHERLDELEARRLRLLERIDEELEKARAERQRLYDEAVEVVFPDGTVHKLFRDGDRVRDEYGNFVSPDIISAEEAANDPRQWSENLASNDLVERLEAQRERVDGLGDQIQGARAQADAGTYSADDLDDRKTEFERLLAAEERSFAPDRADAGPVRNLTGSGLQTDAVPMLAFEQAVDGPLPDQAFEEDFTLPDPPPSAPAPGSAR